MTTLSSRAQSPDPICVLLAEDHPIMREAVLALLTLEGDIRVVGQAENGLQAVALAGKLCPEVIVMDIAMPLMNGLEAARQILGSGSPAKVIFLSANSEQAYVEQAMALGAAGYVIKQTAAHALPAAIRQVHEGGPFFSPGTSKRRRDPENRRTDHDGQLHTEQLNLLTSRELEVLQLIAEGNTDEETAQAIHVSVETGQKHRQTLMDKLDIHDTAGLTRYAIRMGIIESSVQVTLVQPGVVLARQITPREP